MRKKVLIKSIAQVLLLSMVYQLLLPLRSYALTTGPSQPEVQSFEPVGTTEMVDMFTGDFVYNIPLMDVEGYPINISYHSGIGVEQEASWVGLGWNINPGEINRSVRGLPDDFNGEKLEKTISIKEEKNVRVASGANFNLEILGADLKKTGFNVGLQLGLYLNFNNYKGLGVGTNVGTSISTPVGSVGMNMGIGSQTGADVDLNASRSFTLSKIGTDAGEGGSVGVSVSGGTGFNSRSGLKDLSLGAGVSVTADNANAYKNKEAKKYASGSAQAASFGSSIPVGLQNYVVAVTNRSIMNAFQFQVKVGGEVAYTFPAMYLSAMISTMKYANDGTMPAYGYLYAENAGDESLMDFSRDKDGTYNSSLPNLPPSSMTYDVYSVNGQGTGGMFRPFRNDIGTIYDPKVTSSTSNKDVLLEFGLGNLFEVGSDINIYDMEANSGPWKKLGFQGDIPGTLYEKIYFKQGGELTYNQQQVVSELFNNTPQYLAADASTLIKKGYENSGNLNSRKYNDHYLYKAAGSGSAFDRTSRANLITYRTAAEATKKDYAQQQNVVRHEDNGNGKFFDPAVSTIGRSGNATYNIKDHQLSEFTQTLPDGRRYTYGIPAMNNATREVTFSIDENAANIGNGLVKIDRSNSSAIDDGPGNKKGRDNYYSSTQTPAYAHSYLLTSVLSNDYVDIMGDGATDDDLGTYVKFNYTLKDDDYRWRTPYPGDSAQYNPGFWSDKMDGKGSYLVGSRHQWYVRSIESRNYIAEFYTSPRNDGKGVQEAVLPAESNINTSLKSAKQAPSLSYKLDSIKLYNKHDRYINEGNAVPVKTVIFKYNYNLCKKIPNIQSSSAGTGKLTLERIFIKYGNSEKNLLSPYVFEYNVPNPDYDFAAKDRWGSYKKNSTGRSNYEFPYTSQDQAAADSVAAWNLTDIRLPSGGKIHVDYESDDYSFVMNKRSMQMFDIVGSGSGPKLERQSTLYENENKVNDYVYFKRRKDRENKSLSLKDNYLEGPDALLYYSFNLDITGTGKYEHVKGYAKVEALDSCTNDADYAYIKLKREPVKNMSLHPATVYGLNTARYYLPHILYPGYKDEDGAAQVLKGLIAAADELVTIWKNPFARFVRDKKGRTFRPDKSWVRLNTPGLTKEGGGVRVKKLSLDDSWNKLSGNPDHASYGKTYDYTVKDDRYGVISSGVASYEPMIGGDENPFRKPVPYVADGGRLLPRIDFFQEEPFGEQFFPGPSVGYSNVTVRSIHAAQGGSSQAEDEHIFYTAREFPVEVEFTDKNAPSPVRTKTLRRKYELLQVLQGYVLRFNDMHGKPKSVKNYVVHTDGTNRKKELITGITYRYHQDAAGKLNNKVQALVRERGSKYTYSLQEVELGKEMDFTVDSRERYNRSFSRTVALNLNSVQWGPVPIYIPTSFFPDKEEEQIFRTMVSTKIIQQYGVLQSVEAFDHGAVTTTENMVYDAETGAVLLSKVNNHFNDQSYDLKYPAHLAYEGMAPAYYNTGFEETADSLIVTDVLDGLLCVKDKNKYSCGDEVMLTFLTPTGISVKEKVWVMGPVWHRRSSPGSGGGGSGDTTGTGGGGGAAPTLPVTDSICVLKVLPRYKTGPNTNWPQAAGKTLAPHAKILRSGRRNNLGTMVQQLALAEAPSTTNVNAFMGSTPFNKVLAVSATTFTDIAQPYDRFNNSVNTTAVTPGSELYRSFNSYVMGYKGNFRPYQDYVRIAGRDYTAGHNRDDGFFGLGSAFWIFSNGTGGMSCLMAGPDSSVLGGVQSPLTQSAYDASRWKRAKTITRYDVHGNALEEMDASGNYSAAQYGFNRGLPVAVAANARQQEFWFEGFEDYTALIPEILRRMHISDGGSGAYASDYYHSPFARLFSSFITDPGSTFPDPTIFSRSGQNFSRLNLVSNVQSNASITGESSHSGRYALKVNGNIQVGLPVKYLKDGLVQLGSFGTAGKKCLLHLWFRPQQGYDPQQLVNQFAMSMMGAPNSNTITARTLKVSGIEGWYQLELTIDVSPYVSNTPTYLSQANFSIPGGLYLDDVRVLPVDANMKSFVYDPFTFRLAAQLDENHMATYYEYDQEGLLVRVKKETDRGIMTVSESRRSNTKKP